MAPKRKKTTVVTDSSASPSATRGTRSSPRLANVAPPPPIANPEPRKRRKKAARASASASAPVTAVEDETEVQEPPPPIANPEPSKRRKKAETAPAAVTTVNEETEVQEQPPTAEKDPVSEPENVDVLKTIVVEHCKQYKSFETWALQVKERLERDVQGVTVVVNPEEPRKGCFEVREENGDVFFKLLDMKRPFKPMMEQDMVEVISKFVEKIG